VNWAAEPATTGRRLQPPSETIFAGAPAGIGQAMPIDTDRLDPVDPCQPDDDERFASLLSDGRAPRDGREDEQDDGPPTLTDKGNARLFVERYGGDLRWCRQTAGSHWLVWSGSRWERDSLRAVDRYSQQVGNMWRARAPAEPPGEPELWSDKEKATAKVRRAILVHASKSESARAMKDLLSVAGGHSSIVTKVEHYDTFPMLFNTPGGTVDLADGVLYGARRADLLTKQAGVTPSGHDNVPAWLGFLTKIMGGDTDPDGAAELVAYWQRLLGYCLSGSTKERCFWILWGEGGDNGKSTLLSTLRHVMGDYAVSTRAQTFMLETHGGGATNAVAALAGARVVTASEPPENAPLNEALIKELTGGEDTITARFLYAEYNSFKATFKVLLACNRRPRIQGTDDSIWRRPRLIPFNITIPKAEQDPDLAEKLRAEAPGILRWILTGWTEYQRIGLADPEIVFAGREDWRSGTDPMAAFLESRCELGAHLGPTPSSDLYAAYRSWAGDGARSQAWFGSELNRKGIRQAPRHDQGRQRIGIALLSP